MPYTTLQVNQTISTSSEKELLSNLGSGRLRGTNNWDRDKLEKCWKLDSFFKESQRLNGMGAMSLPRKVMVPFTFSDGTILPPGVIVAAAPTAIHYDESLYTNAAEFDGLRFSKTWENLVMQGKSDKIEEERLRLTSTHNYFSFEGGRHACPGRFFASTILKSMMVYVILNYDVKLESGRRPADKWYGLMCMPSRKAKVLFKALE
ncbi:cytochrome P450 [Pleurotus eryngii]|uniref:Cytochrome P450 n=1 Tax=Pleurotus eryngii TaxID=5323 RepID=A0A9P6AA54_PLEER|nr:cytochrome P450 [Pleurotus eryngii]